MRCRPFDGLVADVRRRAPWALSDLTDALHPQCVASFVFLYFACLAPIITFGGMSGDKLQNQIVRAALSAPHLTPVPSGS